MRLLDLLGNPMPGSDGIVQIVSQIDVIVTTATMIILAICAAVVVLYAIYIGFRLAKAEDDAARKNAKSQLIYAIVGVVSIVLINMFTTVILDAIKASMGIVDPTTTDGAVKEVVDATMTIIRNVVDALLKVVVTGVTLFALYIGWKLMSAEDDNTRKQAKTQLIYTGIGMIGIVLLTTLANIVLGVLAKPAASILLDIFSRSV